MEHFVIITTNLTGRKFETRFIDGHEFWVVPATIAKHGVMSGSRKELYYPDEVWNKTFNRWNGQPVIINHTYNDEGQPVSCRISEDTLDECCVGYIQNTQYVDGKLRAEFWLSRDRLYEVNSDIADKIKSLKKLEVSTGLFTKTRLAEDGATFNGQSYKHVLEDYVADHVAILTNEKGACSVVDGCGTFNSDSDQFVDFKEWAKKKLKVTINELSHHGIHLALEEQLRERFSQNEGHAFIYDVFSDYIVYSQGGELYRLDYSGTEDNVVLSDEQPVKVQRVITYVTTNEDLNMATNKNSNDQQTVELDEKKAPLINALVNCDKCPFDEDDKPALNAMSEDRLKSLQESFTKKEPEATVNESDMDGKKKSKKKGDEEDDTVTNSKPVTPEEWFNSAPPEVKATFNHAYRLEQEHKKKLVDKIVANVADEQRDAKAKKFMERSVEDLEEIVNCLPEPKEDEQGEESSFGGVFNGCAGSSSKPTANSGKPSPLRLPSVPDFSVNSASKN